MKDSRVISNAIREEITIMVLSPALIWAIVCLCWAGNRILRFELSRIFPMGYVKIYSELLSKTRSLVLGSRTLYAVY